MALNPPWIENRTDSADMEAAVLRPHLCGWLAWIPAFAGMTAVWKVPYPQHIVMPAEAGTHVTLKVGHARASGTSSARLNRTAVALGRG
jgi:hypothetical protein